MAAFRMHSSSFRHVAKAEAGLIVPRPRIHSQHIINSQLHEYFWIVFLPSTLQLTELMYCDLLTTIVSLIHQC